MELANSESDRTTVRIVAGLIVLWTLGWLLLAWSVVGGRGDVVLIVLVTSTFLLNLAALPSILLGAPRLITVEGGSVRARYRVGERAISIGDLREVLFCESPWVHRRRGVARSTLLLRVRNGRGVNLGVLDRLIAERLVDELSRTGCQVKVLVGGLRIPASVFEGSRPAA